MAIVTSSLKDTVGKQVDQHGSVGWFDPNQYSQDAINNLNWPDTTIVGLRSSG